MVLVKLFAGLELLDFKESSLESSNSIHPLQGAVQSSFSVLKESLTSIHLDCVCSRVTRTFYFEGSVVFSSTFVDVVESAGNDGLESSFSAFSRFIRIPLQTPVPRNSSVCPAA